MTTSSPPIEKRLSSSNINDYKFRIEAVFDNDEARHAFQEYLTTTCTVEPLLFYIQVEQYTKLRLDSNRFDKAKEIVDQFIRPSSTHELNLSAELRNTTLQEFDKIERQQQLSPDDFSCSASLFDSVQSACFLELREDSFPRFIRSEYFKKFIKREQKKDSRYLSKIGTTSPSLSTDRTSGSFIGINDLLVLGSSEPYITDEDVHRARHLVEEHVDDRFWRSVADSNSQQTYMSVNQVQVGVDNHGSHSRVIRFDTIIQFDFYPLMYSMLDNQFKFKYDKMLVDSKFIEYREQYNNQKLPYAVSISTETYKGVGLMAKREFLICDTIIPQKFNPETKQFDQMLRVTKSIHLPDYLAPKGRVVRAEGFIVKKITRVAPGITQVSGALSMDFKGYLSNEFVQKMAAKKRKNMTEGLVSVLKESQRNGTFGKHPVNTNGLLDTIRYYVNQHPDQFEGVIF
jgi:hypothetical protein